MCKLESIESLELEFFGETLQEWNINVYHLVVHHQEVVSNRSTQFLLGPVGLVLSRLGALATGARGHTQQLSVLLVGLGLGLGLGRARLATVLSAPARYFLSHTDESAYCAQYNTHYYMRQSLRNSQKRKSLWVFTSCPGSWAPEPLMMISMTSIVMM